MEAKNLADPTSSELNVLLDYSKRINFAFQQNAIPLIRRMELRNGTDRDLTDVICSFRAKPDAWCRDYQAVLASVPANSDYLLSDLPLELDLNYLANLSDRVRGELELEIRLEGSDGESEILHRSHYEVEVYAYNEWTGLTSLPEILAAFVTPNIAVIEEVLSGAADILGASTASSALDGYQPKSKKRVYEILEAIHESIRSIGIRYSNPPASFEQTGQRVRFPDQICQSRLGTCLDLTLLYASTLEQAGLRPLVLFHKGHAYCGCWMIESSFPEATCDDLQAVRKRVEIEEILVFETTLCCEGNRANLAQCEAAAKKHLQRDEDFEHAIDIFRARSSGIRPLPLKRNEAGIDYNQARENLKPKVIEGITVAGQKEFKPDLQLDDCSTRKPADRVEHWKHQLLDLTLRNRLLNFRETKQTVPLVCPHPAKVEDELAADTTFQIRESSKLMEGLDLRSLALLEKQFNDDPVLRHLEEELNAKRIRSLLTSTELGNRLLTLYRRARLEMEESGANTLFIALGFLEWKETKASDRSNRAPIVLIPVTLERKSVQQGFRLRRCDEDAFINVTLLELLRRDFEMEIPGLDPLPMDESGMDVTKILDIFRYATKELSGWEVHPEVWLAQFSFNKFLLWKDLNDRVDHLANNPVVDHLINRAGEVFPDSQPSTSVERLDKELSHLDAFCPVSADSSQLEAIVAAANGKSFVLHGPPGTGKSQTITNLIANSLGQGKRVLFVAEKRAALEVVRRRLNAVGLGPFCLELHSNKVGKSEVLEQIGQALNQASLRSPDEWRRVGDKLDAARGELNAYVEALHHRYPNGLSAYQCYSWCISGDSHGVPEIELRWDKVEEHAIETLEQLRSLCDQLTIRGSKERLPLDARDVLEPFHATTWTPEWEEQLFDAAKEMDSCGEAFAECLGKVGKALAVNLSEISRGQMQAIADLCGLLLNAKAFPPAFVSNPDWRSFRQDADSWVNFGRQRDQARQALEGFDLDALLSLNLGPLQDQLKSYRAKPGFFANLKLRWTFRQVQKIRIVKRPKWTIDQAEEFLGATKLLQENTARIVAANDAAEVRLGTHWAKGEADWDQIDNALELGDGIQETITTLVGDDVDILLMLREKIGRLLGNASEVLGDDTPLGQTFGELQSTWTRYKDATTRFQEASKVSPEALTRPISFLQTTADWSQRLAQGRSFLQNWCRWQDSRQQAASNGLQPLIDAIESGALPISDVRSTFETAYRNAFLRRIITLSATLREFWGDEHQKRILAFNDLDDKFTKLTMAALVARLSGNLPRARQEESPRNSELGILQRELAKKARHKPVRTLLAEAPTVIPHLKPCFLMSPLSVAQYLDVTQENFDLVVFDEASQIPVWDAVGAIARGKQMIVVGDPKQLPPTNFFGRMDSDESFEEDGVTDLESILDECIGSGLPQHNLRWHYRSRREGLIAFSNYQYYKHQLYTFPSPHSEGAGVRLIPVSSGHYDKGRSRTNRAEAEAVVTEVVSRLKDPKRQNESIGIVTFSQAQQTLIMDLVDEARRNHPDIETFFSDDALEPVFVKNLENVQGDERDVIIFSICYGPDASGSVSMNFGPLNRSGGERRLNVAVTRAKNEILVFSTLRSDQIDLSRTRSTGAAHLKAYLEYAERGARSLQAQIQDAHQSEYDSIFEEEVAEFLRNKGYDVHTQVGCSAYRIDLAIPAPDAPGHYLIGIECDGATYHRAATARDRDRLRQMVLESLGWKIHRIWSTDWWRNAANAREQLLKVIAAATNSFKVDTQPLQTNSPNTNNSSPTGEQSRSADNPTLSTPLEKTSNRSIPYPSIEPQKQPNRDLFYQPSARHTITRQFKRILQNEGPMTENLLFRRVAEEWDFRQLGTKIRTILQNAVPTSVQVTQINEDPVYWPEKSNPKDYTHYRVPTDDENSKRAIDDIPLKELENAALDTIEEYISLPTDDLIKAIANRFGIQRTSPKIASKIQIALHNLTDHSKIQCNQDVYRIAPDPGAAD